MKQLHIVAACAALFIAFNTGAQNVAINTDGALPNAGVDRSSEELKKENEELKQRLK